MYSKFYNRNLRNTRSADQNLLQIVPFVVFAENLAKSIIKHKFEIKNFFSWNICFCFSSFLSGTYLPSEESIILHFERPKPLDSAFCFTLSKIKRQPSISLQGGEGGISKRGQRRSRNIDAYCLNPFNRKWKKMKKNRRIGRIDWKFYENRLTGPSHKSIGASYLLFL